MLLAKVNYLCGVSPGVGERHFSSDLESQLHIKKSQPESRIHSPLAFTTRSKTVWKPPKTSEELYIKNTRSSSLTQHSVWTKHTHKISLLLLYWKRKRQANGLQDSCADTFHLSHRSENRPALVKQLENGFQSCKLLMTEDSRCASLSFLCFSYWNHTVVIYKNTRLMFWPLLLFWKNTC